MSAERYLRTSIEYAAYNLERVLEEKRELEKKVKELELHIQRREAEAAQRLAHIKKIAIDFSSTGSALRTIVELVDAALGTETPDVDKTMLVRIRRRPPTLLMCPSCKFALNHDGRCLNMHCKNYDSYPLRGRP